jgi:hypothetical protein
MKPSRCTLPKVSMIVDQSEGTAFAERRHGKARRGPYVGPFALATPALAIEASGTRLRWCSLSAPPRG